MIGADGYFQIMLARNTVGGTLKHQCFRTLYIDNGFYARADSECNNYAGTPASNQCPVG